MDKLLEQIEVLKVFEVFKVTKYEAISENEIKLSCPHHSDKDPSCHINVEKKVYHCKSCQKKGNILEFASALRGQPLPLVINELTSSLNLTSSRYLDAEVIERYHNELSKAGPFLAELRKRAITEELCRKYRIGFDERTKRITIPITDVYGNFVNVRRYYPGASKNKMLNTRGYSSARLFPVDQLQYDIVMVCGGELKAIAATSQLNEVGVGAVTSTGGEGSWDESFTPSFVNKVVYVCFDIDEAGSRAAYKIAKKLSLVSDSVKILTLPLDKEKYPKGDINDFIADGGNLVSILHTAEPFELAKASTELDDTIYKVSLDDAMLAKYIQKRVELNVLVAAKKQESYALPQSVEVHCNKGQDYCSLCPVNLENKTKYEVDKESPVLLEMLGEPIHNQKKALLKEFGIPSGCKVSEFEMKSYYNLEDIRLSPQLEISNRDNEKTMQPAICITSGLTTNSSYRMVGRLHPHPRTQKSTLVLSEAEPIEDLLSTYKLRNPDALEIFSPSDWTLESLSDKLNDIYSDLSNNVTQIYQRQNLHLFIDLIYHSPLFLEIDGKQVKGWVEGLVIGDSSQGKTETAMRLREFYRLGEKFECKNATVAGLLGGLVSMGDKSWFVTWGVIPTHDKRLVILEELKGADPSVISKLTDMRSSGIAELPKIEKARTHARTRILALSNPRSDRVMGTYSYGVRAALELVGAPEDIRRFDMVLALSKDEVNAEELDRSIVDHTYTSDLCRDLILWGWTRDKVSYKKGVLDLILRRSKQLCNEYSDDIPIIDRGSMRFKLARLSAALAIRTFSIGRKDDVVVRPCHVDYIVEYLRSIYNAPAMGYNTFSVSVRSSGELRNKEEIESEIKQTLYPEEFVSCMLDADQVDVQDIQDWTGYDRMEAQRLLSFLVRKNCLKRKSKWYYKTEQFISLLRNVEVETYSEEQF